LSDHVSKVWKYYVILQSVGENIVVFIDYLYKSAAHKADVRPVDVVVVLYVVG
jgi:hypothetical protein